MRDSSWVVVRKSDGEPIFETYNPRLVAALNTQRYVAMPIYDWLRAFNRAVSLSGGRHA